MDNETTIVHMTELFITRMSVGMGLVLTQKIN